MSDTAVVWVALGTPETPTPQAVRRYLREFLSDRRIVEMNPIAWRLILECFILPFRPRQSAKKYRSIWYENGSPLLVHTREQAAALGASLAGKGVKVEVAWAMRYGRPSLASVLDELRDKGVRKVLVVPAYAQYSSTTVGSVLDAMAKYILASRDQLELRFVRSYPTHPMYVESLAQTIEASWEAGGRPDFDAGDKLLLSYHGIPVSMAEAGDPYPQECLATTTALRTRLGLDDKTCLMTFQSKFGPAPWITPATIDTVADLGRQGVKRLDVACPAFTADCLETLEEIGILNREAYMDACGHDGTFVRIPCVNDDPLFIDALTDVVLTNLSGWLD